MVVAPRSQTLRVWACFPQNQAIYGDVVRPEEINFAARMWNGSPPIFNRKATVSTSTT